MLYPDSKASLELHKSLILRFSGYKKSIKQAARYGQQLNLKKIALVFFVEAIDDANRAKYEVITVDAKTNVSVEAIFVSTSS